MDKTILFDVMGTLVYDPYLIELPAFFGLSFAELVAQKDRTVWPAFEKGEISEAQFLEHYFGDHRDIDAAGLRSHLKSAYRLLDGVDVLLADLKSREVEMHAFSNYPVWYKLIEDSLQLSDFLNWTFVSCEIGMRKPDLKIFEFAVDTLARDPSSLVFVDDRPRNVAAAQEAGMHGIVFESSQQLRAEFLDLGVL